mgnify:CR=1 FL=1
MTKNSKYRKVSARRSDSYEIEACEDGTEEVSNVMASTKNLNVIYSLNNHLYYYKDIDSEGSALFCKTISEMYYNIISSMLSTGLTNPVIELHINSEGGDFSAAAAMASKIEEVKKGFGPVPIPMKVITHVEGESCSGGSLMSVVGSERTISRYSFMLIHKASSGFVGKTEDMKDHVKNIELVNSIMKTIYKENSKLSEEELDKIMDKDLYFSPEDCVKHGLVDRII